MNLKQHSALKTDLDILRNKDKQIVLNKKTEKYINSFNHKEAIKDWNLFDTWQHFKHAKQAM